MNDLKAIMEATRKAKSGEERKPLFDGVDLKGSDFSFIEMPDCPKEVPGTVNLASNYIKRFNGNPVKVGIGINMFNNRLLTLEKGPKEVGYNASPTTGYYIIKSNQVENLQGAPEKVNGWFDASGNRLITLSGTLKEVTGKFNVSYNKNLVSISDFFPKTYSSIIISDCNLESVMGLPDVVEGFLMIRNNNVQTLDGFPKTIKGNLYFENNPVAFTEEEIREICDVKGKIYL